MNKKGVDPVIGTVLLVLAALVAGGIVTFVAIPLVRDVDTSCLDALRSLSFEDVGFSCTLPAQSANEQPLSAFSIRISDKNIAGFQVGFKEDGSADSYEVVAGSRYSFLCSLDRLFDAPLAIPETNGVRTYIVKGEYDKIFIAPILSSGKKCFKEGRKEIEVKATCIDPAVKQRILNCAGTSGGVVCGNDRAETGEECDGTDLGGKDCTTIPGGFTGGILACYPPEQEDNKCTFNTAGCTSQPPPECELSNLRWETTSAREGQEVNLIIESTNCNGRTIEFEILEDDVGSNTQASVQPTPIVINSNSQTISIPWTAEWIDDSATNCFLINCNPPEYFFRVQVQNSGNWISSNNELEVLACGDRMIQDPPEECDSDEFGAGGNSCGLGWTGTLQCVPRGQPGQCTTDRSGCVPTTLCGNGQLDPGETCDPNHVPTATQVCTTSGGYSGTQICSSQCNGYGSCTSSQYCGDGEVNGPEQCEPGQSQQCTPSGGGTQGTSGFAAQGAGSGGESNEGSQSCNSAGTPGECQWGVCVINP